MARVLDDIVLYFRQEGVDILATANVYVHCLEHLTGLWDAITRRSHPEADLLRAVIESEQEIERLGEQVRELWADRRRLTFQLEMSLRKESN